MTAVTYLYQPHDVITFEVAWLTEEFSGFWTDTPKKDIKLHKTACL